MRSGRKNNKIKDFFLNSKKDFIKTIVAILLTLVVVALVYLILGWNGVGNLSAILQYLTVILALFAWYNTTQLLVKRKKEKINLDQTDLVLMISLSNPIESDVKAFCQNDDSFRSRIINETGENEPDPLISDLKHMDLYKSDCIKNALEIRAKSGKSMPNKEGAELDEYLTEYKECIEYVARTMSKESIGKVHLFFSAPGELLGFLMPYFTNKKGVVLYRHPKDGNYFCLGEPDIHE